MNYQEKAGCQGYPNDRLRLYSKPSDVFCCCFCVALALLPEVVKLLVSRNLLSTVLQLSLERRRENESLRKRKNRGVRQVLAPFENPHIYSDVDFLRWNQYFIGCSVLFISHISTVERYSQRYDYLKYKYHRYGSFLLSRLESEVFVLLQAQLLLTVLWIGEELWLCFEMHKSNRRREGPV